MPATQQYWVFTAHVTQAAVGAFVAVSSVGKRLSEQA